MKLLSFPTSSLGVLESPNLHSLPSSLLCCYAGEGPWTESLEGCSSLSRITISKYYFPTAFWAKLICYPPLFAPASWGALTLFSLIGSIWKPATILGGTDSTFSTGFSLLSSWDLGGGIGYNIKGLCLDDSWTSCNSTYYCLGSSAASAGAYINSIRESLFWFYKSDWLTLPISILRGGLFYLSSAGFYTFDYPNPSLFFWLSSFFRIISFTHAC